MIALASEPIDPAALLAEFTRATSGAGAIASFSGLVRPDGGVSELWIDHHPRLTPAAFKALADEAQARFAIADVDIVHRVGAVATGQPIVFVAAAAPHRRAAFDAVDFVMDRLKSKVPLWKQERRYGSACWVEPRAEDHADAARWDTIDG
jgi:molybdopterin synthase catalytic subunit